MGSGGGGGGAGASPMSSGSCGGLGCSLLAWDLEWLGVEVEGVWGWWLEDVV